MGLFWSRLVVEEQNLQVQNSSLRSLLGQEAIPTNPRHGYQFTVQLVGKDESGAAMKLTPRTGFV
jgi:DNA-binding winged helix-turn-helix (wHTH) protein